MIKLHVFMKRKPFCLCWSISGVHRKKLQNVLVSDHSRQYAFMDGVIKEYTLHAIDNTQIHSSFCMKYYAVVMIFDMF